MKRLISAFICFSIIISVASCSKQTTISQQSENTAETTTDLTESSAQGTKESLSSDAINALGDVEVDEGLFNVTVTVPADLAGKDASQESVDKAVAENGYVSGTYNSDGSVTYIMTKAKHEETMKTLSEGLDKSLQEIVDSKDYPGITEITHNEDYTDFKIMYSGDKVGLSESLTVVLFYYTGGMYGVFNGTRPDNIHVTFVNSKTGKIIEESNSKDLETNDKE